MSPPVSGVVLVRGKNKKAAVQKKSVRGAIQKYRTVPPELSLNYIKLKRAVLFGRVVLLRRPGNFSAAVSLCAGRYAKTYPMLHIITWENRFVKKSFDKKVLLQDMVILTMGFSGNRVFSETKSQKHIKIRNQRRDFDEIYLTYRQKNI